MKLSISREALLTPLQFIGGVVERKQTMPILSNLLMTAGDGKLVLTGTNMEVELICLLDEVSIQAPGSVTVPARKLVDICRSLPDGAELAIELQESRLHVKSGKSHFTLATLSADNFPVVEEESQRVTVTLPQNQLKGLIEATAFAMAQQDVRYYLNGMLLELVENSMRSVSTDGHRLAFASCDQATGAAELVQIVVPRKGVLELSKLLDDGDAPVVLHIGQNHIRAELNDYVFTSKLIEGKFPDYNRVIPRGVDKEMVADRHELRSMFQRASILSHENIRGIRLTFKQGQLDVQANNPEHEQAEETLAVDYQAEEMEIGFNVGYLIDVLNAIDSDQVVMKLSNANSSALIHAVGNESALYVVMPMRL